MFLSIAQRRRSIRKFEKKEVEADKVDMLLEAALRAADRLATMSGVLSTAAVSLSTRDCTSFGVATGAKKPYQ